MIAHALPEIDYDDENIHLDCEDGWRRFSADVLARTHRLIRDMCARYRRDGVDMMPAKDRIEMEQFRRQVAAYRWVMAVVPTGPFTFEDCCEDVGRDPYLTRKTLLSGLQPPADINLLVGLVESKKERKHANGRRQDHGAGRMGTSLIVAVGDLRRENAARESRASAGSPPVRRKENKHPRRRRPAGAGAERAVEP